MGKKLVAMIDTQFDFMMTDGKLPVPGAEEIIVPTMKFLSGLNPDEVEGVLFTYDTHDAKTYEGSPESEQFPIHCVKGTVGWENVFSTDLVPVDIDVAFLEKSVFNMWEEDDLWVISNPLSNPSTWERDLFIARMRDRGVDTVVVLGVAADFCVKEAIEGFLEHGFNVEVPAALTRGIVRQFDQVLADDFDGNNVRVI